MITTALFGSLLLARAIIGVVGSERAFDRLPVLDRLLVPAGVAFAALVAVRLLDLWLRHA